MSFNYSGLSATSTRLINRFGADVTLHIKTEGVYDPVTGANGDTFADSTVRAVKLNFSNGDIDGTLIKQGDFMLMIDGVTTFTSDDKITVDGIKYAVVRQMPLKPGDTRLLTKAHCRK